MASETVQSSAEVPPTPGLRFSEHPGKLGGGRTQKAEIPSFSSSWLGSEIAKGWVDPGEKVSIKAGAEGEEEPRTRSLLGTPTPVVVRVGSDLALPLDASRAQSHHRGTGQCRKDHHSLSVVSNY